jgi:hypothetical protein
VSRVEPEEAHDPGAHRYVEAGASDGTPAGADFVVNTYTVGLQRSPHQW